MSELLPQDYPAFLQSLKERIRQAQTRAALAVSRELMGLYWQIGRDLEAAVRQGRWGEKVIERVAGDLKREFPGVEGFSKRNLERMRAFYQAYPDEGQFAAQPVSQLPWGHNLVFCRSSKTPPSGCGTPNRPCKTAGAGLFWKPRSKPAYTGAKGQP